MSQEEIDKVSFSRLGFLEKQAAQFGPRTDPAVLIEIQEIYNQYPELKRGTRSDHTKLDYDFLMNVLSATLIRFNVFQSDYEKDQKKRATRQLIHDIWMIVITIVVFLDLALLLVR